MEKIPLTIRVTASERQMLQKRASRYGMTMNGLVRFWIHSEPDSPRAFSKFRCSACNGTGRTDGNPCKKCRAAGFSYYEV